VAATLVPVVGCLSVAAVFSVTLLGIVAPAGADQVSSLQAQAAQLTQEMTLEQLQVGGYEQQSQAAAAEASSDEASLAHIEATISAVRSRISHDQLVLQQSAVTAYVEGDTTSGSPQLFIDERTTTASLVYEQVVAGSLNAAMNQLKSDRKSLAAELSSEQQLVAADLVAQSQAQVLLTDAQTTAASLQAQAAQIDTQLATAIAQQQAQDAASADAARAAAQQQAAAAPPASTGSSAPVTAGPLPPFLVCVLQAESGGNYQAVSPTGQYMGGFQFSQTTWNHAAVLAGLPTLIGVPPYDASPADQNALAIALYDADGEQPWYDPCRS
jgi:hypothetical protein